MSRRRQAGAVRGPASALTSFLAGLGVEPNRQLTTWGNTSDLNAPQSPPGDGSGPSTDLPITSEGGEGTQLAHDGPILPPGEGLDPAGAVTARLVESGPTEAGEENPIYDDDEKPIASGSGWKRRKPGTQTPKDESETSDLTRKRPKRASSVDSDDLDDFEQEPVVQSGGVNRGSKVISSATGGATSNSTALKGIGEFMACGECSSRFTVTVYTKEHPNKPSTWLCTDCCHKLGIDPFAKAKKAAALKKKPVKKEDRAKVVSYETRKGVPPLGDLCIQLIGKFIEDVEQLGDIGGVNMDKVCRIISKSRRLTPETAALFFSADRTELDMYDCTNLKEDTYLTLANLCPNLKSLRLHLCGQLTTPSITHWGTRLTHLTRLELFAPFLVRKEGWLSFFKSVGTRLEGLLITQSPRIDLETIEVLVKSCPGLKELRLSEVGLLNDDFLEPISKLGKLELLDISAPAPGKSLTDEAVNKLIATIGGTLVTLNLSDNFDLTDAILPIIAKHCPKLRNIHLNNLVELTDPGIASFFTQLKTDNHPGFEIIDLEKGHELASASLEALLSHSGGSMTRLNMMGWKDVSHESVGKIAGSKGLKDLDMGWCRNIDDFSVKDVLNGCDSIEVVRVWGCNQLTDAVPRKRGVKVIGIETHTI